MADDTPRRNAQVAAGRRKMQFVVDDAFWQMLHDRAAVLGTTMTDVMTAAVTKVIEQDTAREERRAARRGS